MAPLPELPHEVWRRILSEVSLRSLHGARLAFKQLRSIVDTNITRLSIRLQPGSADFWRSGGLRIWPKCSSVSLVWDARVVTREQRVQLLRLPFAGAPEATRQRVTELAIEEDPIDENGVFDIPAAPLAALLSLLRSLVTVRLPSGMISARPDDADPSRSFGDRSLSLDPNGTLLAALRCLHHLRDLTLPNLGLAEGLGALGGAGLTRLVVLDGLDDRGDGLTEDGVLRICFLQGLRHLELHPDKCYKVTAQHVQLFLFMLPRLEQLTIRNFTVNAGAGNDAVPSCLTGTTLALRFHTHSLISIDLAATTSARRSHVPLRDLDALVRALAHGLLPRARPCPKDAGGELRLACSVGLGPAGPREHRGWLLASLLEEYTAARVQVPSLRCRGATAAEVEQAVRLLGKPEKLILYVGPHETARVRLRGPHDAPALDTGDDGGGVESWGVGSWDVGSWGVDGGASGADDDSEVEDEVESEGESASDGAEDGAGQPVPGGGGGGGEERQRDRELLEAEGTSAALAAIWADPGGGSELRRLRRMLALALPGGQEEFNWGQEEPSSDVDDSDLE
ncbi:hypothetical protein HYH03_016169 [Edaphochlamys debaryana]|uniref:F-box domain-containing protein n=1 Tax=Edaphochlamys debaryana TaxID=47281 RepID=A0A835XI20_9CHLO|nr:hypothetical protein HYH03_016169 [Edaphochlamys debaryana]|eukprot:KAG2485072.1 hypothetical protein HYH03_016169 [Edaphochlamys debaryana]